MLLAAMNPCPCGFYGDPTRECHCTGAIIQRYLGKISGPLLDRIDLHIEVPAVPYQELRNASVGASSAQIAERVSQARAIQNARGFLQRAYSRPSAGWICARSMHPESALSKWQCAVWD